MEAYCVKCKAKREMKDPKEITMKNGRPATQGICPTCGGWRECWNRPRQV
jgi:hypothetical protein